MQSDIRRGETQILIETPYRNQRLFEALLADLEPHVRLCLAMDLCGSEQRIQCQAIAQWRKDAAPQTLPRKPCVFLVGL
jgi:16S rRNA (cytidine1402-2'-O)-methyltransferase